MREHDVLKKNKNFYIGVGGTVLEGLLSGSLFLLLYSVMQFLWAGQFDLNRVLMLTGAIAGIFLLRILIYSYGYTKAQIGGAEVSQNIRLFMGDHLKRIPLSRFTQGQTGDYINTITSDVNNYEKILTHKIGDLAKNFALSIMLIVFVMTIYVPAGLILLAADLLLIPGLWLSFRMVKKYGKEKNDICAENVSSIVEYVSGMLNQYSNSEILTDTTYTTGQTLEQEVTERLPLWDVIESNALFYALKRLNERERYVFLSHVLDNCPFDLIGVRLGLTYKGAAAVYYRAVQKLKKSIEGVEKHDI